MGALNARDRTDRRTRRSTAGSAWRPLAVAWVLMLVVAAGLTPSTSAADLATFGDASAKSKFGETITFDQRVTLLAGPVKRAEILLVFPGALGPEVTEVAAPANVDTLHYDLDVGGTNLKPNTRIVARWRLTGQDGSTQLGPEVEVTYEDTRFRWRTRFGSTVHVYWYQGDSAFGERAAQIGDRAVQDAEKLLGVNDDQPIDFFIYADQAAFYQALGPGTRENVGGEAIPSNRTLFALITPGQIDASWVSVVIPHELTHIVFNTAVDNPYHFPPRWLNEGLAVYLSEGYGVDDRVAAESAARDGSIIPLNGLTGQFPVSTDGFFLAYSESVSAIDFLVKTYGKDALVALIRSYAKGVTDDEAFQAALGVTATGFGDAWLKSLGARAPGRTGPQPAPAGPLPTGWSGPIGAPGTLAPSASQGPARAPGSSGSPSGAPAGRSDPTDRAIGLVLGGILVMVVAAGIAIAFRRSEAMGPPP
jgi:hypothetical protein